MSPSFGSPGTSPSATRHSPFTTCRSSAWFRSSAMRGMALPSARAGRMAGGVHQAQVLREEGQHPRPGIVIGLRVVPRSAMVHEGVIGAWIGMELVGLAVAGQLGIERLHVRRRRVGVLLAEEADQGTLDAGRPLER